MKIAIVGCAHGELEKIYDTMEAYQRMNKIKIDLLICCGDFQASRNKEDLHCMAVPPKYTQICTFYKYYSGELEAPVLTVFIGGNHEASNYLQELPYGGWVAPNIYYMGYAGIINVGGLRIGGLSGIYKGKDYMKGHYEKVPYDENSKRSVYHVRNLEVFRLKQLSGKIDVFLSHDWPSDIFNFGNVKQLLKKKPFFREDVESNQLGSQPSKELLHGLKPAYWFAAHLHCKFAALIKHENKSITRFLALDKCLPKRKFMQIVDIPHDESAPMKISYDLEWLAILFLTNHLLSVKNIQTYMPGVGGQERYNFTPCVEEKNHIQERFNYDLIVPNNFCRTAPVYSKNAQKVKLKALLNPQTIEFCEKLALDDPVMLVAENLNIKLNISTDLSYTESLIDTTANSCENSLGKISLPDPKGDERSSSEEDSGSSSTSDEENTNVADKGEGNLPGASPVPKRLKRRNEELYKS
ncbi:unnamed protein product [Acanthoscelides obtectus]|uniref:Lariat debranching enzyme C-terminal domain-containing protein n=1 Tax=Acanthoscelides obtectus TaxID=200917 RepID=A0A9P0LPA4_ACAOB|nr:unnamed protein product [Acanthoscelides obtectus]CAK1640301.1 Lariat debranching enzyme [Acanthoscelides obtectus]